MKIELLTNAIEGVLTKHRYEDDDVVSDVVEELFSSLCAYGFLKTDVVEKLTSELVNRNNKSFEDFMGGK